MLASVIPGGNDDCRYIRPIWPPLAKIPTPTAFQHVMTRKRHALSLSPALPTMTVSRLPRGVSVLAALVVSLTLCSAPEWTHGAEPLQEATRLARQGQHAQALERVEQILAARPKDPSARFLKGLILSEQGRSADAIATFEKLSEDYPELPEPYNNLAVLYAQQRQYEKARASLEMAIRAHPSYATAYENLGDIYARLASQAYDKALQLDTGNVGAQSKLSLIREIFGIGSKPKPAARLGKARADVAVAAAVEK
ncbi:MAG TPA: tetratricopeptide repeat protein, partial [Rhodocyclaceae bacterium]|nr:tetratricopeptide repeat protein [Rhodocyclaceae bacterium]